MNRAETLLEENRFSEAITAYRELAEKGNCSEGVRFNLQVAIDQEQANFARNIGKKGGYDAKLFEAHVSAIAKEFRQSIDCCTDILKTVKLDPIAESKVRLLRLNSTARAFRYGNLVEDTTWLLSPQRDKKQFLVSIVLRLLSSISNAERIPELKQVIELALLTKPDSLIISMTIDILERLEFLRMENKKAYERDNL